MCRLPKLLAATENQSLTVEIVNRAYIYDNSVDFEDPKLLFRVIDGNITKQYDYINDWANPILEFIKNEK